MSEQPKWSKGHNLVQFPERIPCPYCSKDCLVTYPSNLALCRHALREHNWNKEGQKILDGVVEIYNALRLRQKKVVFGSETEAKANETRRVALGEATVGLYNLLLEFGQDVEQYHDPAKGDRQ